MCKERKGLSKDVVLVLVLTLFPIVLLLIEMNGGAVVAHSFLIASKALTNLPAPRPVL